MNGLLRGYEQSSHRLTPNLKLKNELDRNAWVRLQQASNQWAVYPNVPKKIFQFPSWNPAWSTNNGKSNFLTYRHVKIQLIV